MGNRPGDANTAERRRWLLPWLQEAEQHRTTELQNQQARAATILAANTFLLGLLASAALQGQYSRRASIALLVAIALASLALVAGLAALYPLTAPASPHFLDRKWLRESATAQCEEDLLADLVNSLVPEADPVGTIRFRRTLLRTQLLLLGVGTLAAMTAVVFVLF